MASNYYEVTWKRKGERSSNMSTGVYAGSPEEARRKVLSGHRDIEILSVNKR